MWLCMLVMQRCLGGNYINFAVFELYSDPALKVGRRGKWVEAG